MVWVKNCDSHIWVSSSSGTGQKKKAAKDWILDYVMLSNVETKLKNPNQGQCLAMPKTMLSKCNAACKIWYLEKPLSSVTTKLKTCFDYVWHIK